jgi:hypothetical protein
MDSRLRGNDSKNVARMSEATSGADLDARNPACRFAHAGYIQIEANQ